MRISIIIPVHNAGKYIEFCINSIINQDYEDFEIILIENNSTDDSYEKCVLLSNMDKRITLFSTKDKGVSAARNIGLAHVTGDIVTFCDADDYLEPNSLTKVIGIIERTETDILVTGINKRKGSNIYDVASYSRDKQVSAEKLIAMVINDRKIMGGVWNKFYRREILKDIKFDTSLTHCEDLYFNICVLNKNLNSKCLISYEITYNYYYNEMSATNDISKIYNSNNQLNYNVTLNKAKKEIKLSESNMKELEYAIFALSLAEYCRLIDVDNEEKKEKMKILYDNMKLNLLGYIKCFPRYFKKSQIKQLMKCGIYRLGGEK